MNFYKSLSLEKVVLLPWNFLSLRNWASQYMPWTSKEILAFQKLYYCFEVLEESSLRLRFRKKSLANLKMSSGLLKCFILVWFCIFCLPNIWHFSQSSSHLILEQIFAPLDCLRFPCCHSVCPPFCWGGWTSNQIFKKQGQGWAWQHLKFEIEEAGKELGDFFSGDGVGGSYF